VSAADASLDLSALVTVTDRVDDLAALHASLSQALAKLGGSYEILYLVSREFEGAFRQARGFHERDPARVRVVRFGQPVNETTALSIGARRARGRLVATVPSYFDADLECLPRLAAEIDGGTDFAVASRAQPRVSGAKRVQRLVFNRLASVATGTDFRDMASATRLMRREVLLEIPLHGEFHRFLPALAHRLGFAVREVEVKPDARSRAPGWYRPRTYFWRLLDLLSVFFLSYFTRRPLRLFGAVGTLFALSGTAILLVVGLQRLAFGMAAAGRPVLVLGVLLLGLGVQAFTIGLLGELLLFFHARELPEYRLSAVHEADPPPLPPREPADECPDA